jgi:ankyrin repeat protein
LKPAKELAIAAGSGDVGRVREMLEQAPELAKDWQPMMDACYAGRAAVVKLLLERGADPNVLSKSSFHYRPLHRTVEHKVTAPRGPEHGATAAVLLAAGAHVMARGSWHQLTAIALAARGGETQFFPLLLPKLPQRDLFTAAILGDAERVSALLKQDPAGAQRKDENGWTALRYCAESHVDEGDERVTASLLAIAEELLRNGADPRPGLGPTLGTNRPAMAEMLLQAGAKVDDGDSLVHAAEAGNFAVLDLLVRYGADLHCTRGTEHHGGYTPLGCLMTIRSAKGASWFLQQPGIDPNHVGGDKGETALHVAARYGCAPDTLKLLVDHGVNVNARDKDGQTALAVARAAGKTKAAQFLEGIGAE